MSKTLAGLVRVLIGAALVVWLWRSGVVDFGALRGLFSSPLPLLALAFVFTEFVVLSWRLVPLFELRGLRLGLADSLRLTLIGNFFSFILPGGADLARLYYAGVDAPGRRVEIGVLLLVDRLIGMAGLLLGPLLLVPFATDLLSESAAVRSLLFAAVIANLAVLAGATAAFSTSLRNSRLVVGVLRRLPMRDQLTRVVDTVHELGRHRTVLLQLVLVSLVAYTLAICAVVVLTRIIHGPVSWAPVGFLALMGFVANSLPITPGGLGVGEAAFAALLGLAGVDDGAAIMIGWRLLLLVLAPIGLVLYLRGRSKPVASRPM